MRKIYIAYSHDDFRAAWFNKNRYWIERGRL